ncbi:hypothetical protein DXG03_004856 [Asterophora parasitica]|uniref:Uncharacterized protein n=1 Tax=Asterophora parasitica TaxID=117018 RepID=A0A9P7KI09_9AGAR|nr:hypothetical protein DXG03_004856 [Asterophora parasitica]
MPSFRIIFAVAATAFAALSSAAPVNVPAIPHAVNTKNYGRPAAARSFDIVNRDGDHAALSSLPQTLLDAQAKLTVIADKLNDITTAKVDVAVALPILDEVKSILVTAVASVKVVVGHPVEVVLGLGGKVMSVLEVAKLLSAVLTLVATIVASVVRRVGSAAVHPIVASIGGVLSDLLTIVFPSVKGLLEELNPLLGPVTRVLLNLGLTNVVQLLKV